MINVWVIGLLLSFLGIWFLKNSVEYRCIEGRVGIKRPVLRVWLLIILLIGSMIPVVNIVESFAVFAWWISETYINDNWEFTQKDNKIVQFLNKPIK